MADAKLRCLFTVTGGIGVGVPDPKVTRTWQYMDDDWQRDIKLMADAKATGKPAVRKLDTMKAEAFSYAQVTADPEKWNWVKLDWVWYS